MVLTIQGLYLIVLLASFASISFGGLFSRFLSRTRPDFDTEDATALATKSSILTKRLLKFRGGATGNDDKTEKIKGTCIGIDLGTTYSCVAVWKNGRVEVCPNEQGNRITPSYVAWTQGDGQRLVGDAAKNQAASNPSNTIFDVKRLIGRKFSDASVQRDSKLLPYKSELFLLYSTDWCPS